MFLATRNASGDSQVFEHSCPCSHMSNVSCSGSMPARADLLKPGLSIFHQQSCWQISQWPLTPMQSQRSVCAFFVAGLSVFSGSRRNAWSHPAFLTFDLLTQAWQALSCSLLSRSLFFLLQKIFWRKCSEILWNQ